jgi:NAD(P)-dependent dehydrogenase (short-subunit alcohol dehydrogenase family)
MGQLKHYFQNCLSMDVHRIGIFITAAVNSASLFKGCRNVEAGEKVAESVRSCGIKGGEVSCFLLDVGSFKSIKKFAELVLNRLPRIDLLINNGMYMLFIHSLIS